MPKISNFRCGVTDFYYSKISTGTNGALTYGTPAVLGGTASVRVAFNKGENKVFESDLLVRNNSRVSGANVEYSSRSVDPATEMDILYGATASEAGDYIVGPNDHPAPIAVGFARSRTDGKYDAYWFLYTEPSAVDIDAETATDSENTPATAYNFAAQPRPDTGKTFRFAICASDSALAAFFASVMPSSSGNGGGGSGGGESA